MAFSNWDSGLSEAENHTGCRFFDPLSSQCLSPNPYVRLVVQKTFSLPFASSLVQLHNPSRVGQKSVLFGKTELDKEKRVLDRNNGQQRLFNQEGPLDRLEGERHVFSYDLKNATDRWPLLLLFEVMLAAFDRSFTLAVEAFISSRSQGEVHHDGGTSFFFPFQKE